MKERKPGEGEDRDGRDGPVWSAGCSPIVKERSSERKRIGTDGRDGTGRYSQSAVRLMVKEEG
jgi:hypothetical protein